jgi:hypothetical protein
MGMSEKIGRRTAFDLICATYSQFSVPVKKLRNRVPVFTKPGDTNEKAKKAAAMYDVYKDALGYGASPLGGAGEINKRIEEKILPELQQLPDKEVVAILYECRNLARRYELPVRIPDGEIEIVDENTRGPFDWLLDPQDKNAVYDTVGDMKTKLLFPGKTVFIDAPYEPKNGDGVEFVLDAIENQGIATVLHPANSADLNRILNEGDMSRFIAIIITGGHGKESRPGQIGNLNFAEIKVTGNKLKGIHVYFPDCSLGTPKSMQILRSSLGSEAVIHAFDYATLERTVSEFLKQAALDTKPDVSLITSNFNQIKPVPKWLPKWIPW